MTVSFASDPEPVKNVCPNGAGLTSPSNSDNSIAGGWAVWKKLL